MGCVPEGWKISKISDIIVFDPKMALSKDRMKQFVPMSTLSPSSMILNEADFTETVSSSGSRFQNGDALLARITPCLENGKNSICLGHKGRRRSRRFDRAYCHAVKVLKPIYGLLASADQRI